MKKNIFNDYCTFIIFTISSKCIHITYTSYRRDDLYPYTVQCVQQHSPGVKIPLQQKQGNKIFPLQQQSLGHRGIFDSKLCCYGGIFHCPGIATGEYVRENHKFRVCDPQKLNFLYFSLDRSCWDKHMLHGIIDVRFYAMSHCLLLRENKTEQTAHCALEQFLRKHLLEQVF